MWSESSLNQLLKFHFPSFCRASAISLSDIIFIAVSCKFEEMSESTPFAATNERTWLKIMTFEKKLLSRLNADQPLSVSRKKEKNICEVKKRENLATEI